MACVTGTRQLRLARVVLSVLQSAYGISVSAGGGDTVQSPALSVHPSTAPFASPAELGRSRCIFLPSVWVVVRFPRSVRIRPQSGTRFPTRPSRAKERSWRPIWHSGKAQSLSRGIGRCRLPKFLYCSFQYQAKSWRNSQRVIAKVEWHHGAVMSSYRLRGHESLLAFEILVRLYNGRGTAQGRTLW
jgi:hypothetical protein